jgi:hypothetical protein
MRREIGTAALLVAGAVLANVAFAVLGAVFDYPDILGRPPAEVLSRYRADSPLIGGLFLVLAAGAALLAPIALRLPTGRLTAAVGVTAAAVQVVGLLRWPILVPFLDQSSFPTVNTVLGQVIGETLGYALTATWTVLVTAELHRAGTMGRASSALGLAAAALIATGLLVPLGVPGTDLANFVGYIAWSGWLLVLAARLVSVTRYTHVQSAA